MKLPNSVRALAKEVAEKTGTTEAQVLELIHILGPDRTSLLREARTLNQSRANSTQQR
jgi:hypothetical protein